MDRFANGSRAVVGSGGSLTLEPSRPRAGIALGWVYVPLLIAVLAMAAAALGGCASQKSGPGVECDQCALSETSPSALAPGGVAQVASAEGGQRASNQPTQMDPGARGVHTVLSRGTGANTDSSTTTETRSQAGAPSVNQGLILPTAAENGGGSGASNEAAKTVAAIREMLRLEYATKGPGPGTEALFKQLADAQLALAAAEQGARPQITYNLQNAVSTQTVANGSKSGGGDNQDAVQVPKSTSLTRTIKAPGAAAVEQPEPAAPAPAPPAPPVPAPETPAPGMQ